jgi:hypothetical protein
VIVGIVGVEAAKLIPISERAAAAIIKKILRREKATTVCSGHCHLGGIDILAEGVAEELGLKTLIFPPKVHNWSQGYRPRNLLIASRSDVVYCITVKTLPPGFKGMRFGRCYHCNTTEHVKSGGCWTVKMARRLGKRGEVVVVG